MSELSRERQPPGVKDSIREDFLEEAGWAM